MGKSKYDFFFPKLNKYVEITSYNYGSPRFKSYMKQIYKKEKYIQKIGAEFEFIKYIPTQKEYLYVRKNMK